MKWGARVLRVRSVSREEAWRTMPLWLLKLMAGLGRAVPKGSRPSPGGTPGPVRITGRELMTAATPQWASNWTGLTEQ